MPNGFTSILKMLAAAIGLSIYLILLLSVESQVGIAALLVIGVIAMLASARFRVTAQLGNLFGERDSLLNLMIVLAVLIVTGFFYEDHFVLLLVATVIIYVIACLGLNLQFGYSGVLNFAGAAFFDALASNRGIVLLDMGVRPRDPHSFDDLQLRCEVVKCRLTESNLFLFDTNMLVQAVECASIDETWPEAFFQTYCYG